MGADAAAHIARESPGANRPLLIIWHSRTGAARALAKAAHDGAYDGAHVGAIAALGPDTPHGARCLPAEAVNSDIALASGGYLFVAPENLGTLSGQMKEMFDRLYYPLLGQIEGRPYATIIAAGNAGQGAEAQIDTIVTGWRLRRVAPGMIVRTGADRPESILAPKTIAPHHLALARELGMGLAMGLETGIF